MINLAIKIFFKTLTIKITKTYNTFNNFELSLNFLIIKYLSAMKRRVDDLERIREPPQG